MLSDTLAQPAIASKLAVQLSCSLLALPRTLSKLQDVGHPTPFSVTGGPLTTLFPNTYVVSVYLGTGVGSDR